MRNWSVCNSQSTAPFTQPTTILAAQRHPVRLRPDLTCPPAIIRDVLRDSWGEAFRGASSSRLSASTGDQQEQRVQRG